MEKQDTNGHEKDDEGKQPHSVERSLEHVNPFGWEARDGQRRPANPRSLMVSAGRRTVHRMNDRYVYPSSAAPADAYRDLGITPPWERVYKQGRDVTDEDPSTWPWWWSEDVKH